VHAWLCYEQSAPQVRVTNNVFFDNRAAEDEEETVQGRSVALSHSATAEVRNCVAYPDGQADNYYNMPGGGDFQPEENRFPDCIYDDPDFCGTGTHPYWLDTQSPARGEGLNPGGTPYVPDEDIVGNERPGDSTTDMGAYEDNDTCPQQ
jgi:hypothetical protein